MRSASTRRVSGARGKWTFGARVSALAIAVGGLLSVPAMASTSSGSTKTFNQLVKEGLKFYKGKTITLICGGSVGALFNTNCQDIIPALNAYLHANVEILSVPQGSNIPAQDDANAATPNGLTFGELDVSNDVNQRLTNIPGLNFNPERTAFLGGAGPDVSVLLAQPGSGITSFKQVVDSKTPVKILIQTTGSGTVRMHTMIGVFGIDANLITGYTSSGSEQTGFVRGDGTVAELTFTNAVGLVQGGKAVPILINTKLPAGFPGQAALASVPTLEQFAKANPPKSKLQKKAYVALQEFGTVLNAPQFFTNGKVPIARVDALRAAIKFAETNSAVKAVKIRQGLTPRYSTWTAGKQAFVTALSDGKIVLQYLNAPNG